MAKATKKKPLSKTKLATKRKLTQSGAKTSRRAVNNAVKRSASVRRQWQLAAPAWFWRICRGVWLAWRWLVQHIVRFRAALMFGLVAAGTLIVRALAGQMYDIHMDEVTYAYFAQTIQADLIPHDFGGPAFFLHPPGYFYLLAAWRGLFWHGGNIFQEYMVLRGLNMLLAVPTVLVLMALARRLTASLKLAIIVGIVFMVDSFAIRQNVRVFIEAAVVMWLLVGVWLLLRALDGRPKIWKYALAGLAFGLAVLTKDVAALLVLATLGMMIVVRAGIPFRAYLYLLPAMAVPYAGWLGWVAARGYWGQFLHEKTLGLRRLLGLVQETGFNAVNAPSKSGAFMRTFSEYGPAYVVMAVGAAATLALLVSRDKMRRRWGAFMSATTAMLGYMLVGGTFEEHYLYFLFVPGLVTLVVAAREMYGKLTGWLSQLAVVVAGVILLALVDFNVYIYAKNLATPDKGWIASVQWVSTHVPAGSTICTWEQGQFLLDLTQKSYDVCAWHTPADLYSNHVEYILVPEELVYDGYIAMNRDELDYLRRTATLLFTVRSRDTGNFVLFKQDRLDTEASRNVNEP